MTARRTSPVRLIAAREIQQRLRSRSFIVFTALIAVLIIGFGILHRVLSDDGPDRSSVTLAGQVPSGMTEALVQAGQARNLEVTVTEAADRAAALEAVETGDVDAAVVAGGGSSPPEIVFHKEVDTDLRQLVDSAWQVSEAAERASALGLTPDQVNEVLSPAPLEGRVLDPESEGRGVGFLVGTIAAILLFASVNTFGGYVLTGVVEEKTTAVVEILLAQVRADQLLAGKVLGIGVVALVQFVTAVLSGIVALRISGIDVDRAVWVAVPTVLIWFVTGFALYSTLFALAGSFVSRQEDAQSAAAPISLVFLAAYLVVFTVGYAPESTAATVLSLLPPFAPLLMPIRMATGAAPIWQLLVSGGLLLGSIFVVIRFAGSVYSMTLLHRGSRVRWREAFNLRAAAQK